MEFLDENMFLFKCYQELLQPHRIYQILPFPLINSNAAYFGANEISEQNEPLNLTMNSEEKPNKQLNDDKQLLRAGSSSEPINLSGKCDENQLNSYESSNALYNQILQLVFYARPVQPCIPNTPSPAEVTNKIAKAFEECKRSNKNSTPVKMKKPYRSHKCNQCGQDFATTNNLTEHTVSIHGRYKCHICQVGFVRRYNLMRHAVKHLHIAPYMCQVCSKEFVRKDCLCSHISSDHLKKNPKKHVIEKMPPLEMFDFIDKQENFETKEREIASCSRTSMEKFEEQEEQLDASYRDNIFLKGDLI